VFFTHAKEIFGQSHKRIEERLGIKVGKIGDGKWDEQQVTIVMIPTIQKYMKEPKELPKVKKLKDLDESLSLLLTAKRANPDEDYTEQIEKARKELDAYKKEQWDKIKANVKKTQKFLKSIVAFLGDEVHHASSDTWYKVFMGLDKAYYRFGLTGTVDESDPIGLKRLLGCTGKIITKVSNDFLIEQGHSAKPTIYMLPIPTKILNYNYADARLDGIIENYDRNLVFVEKIAERVNSGKQCLIIVNETRHGDIVSEMLGDYGFNFEFIHGNCTTKFRDSALEMFKAGDLRALIATTILDEGVDVPNINCLFLMAGGKSMKKVLQRIGRGLRKKEDGSGLEVYDALDYHNEYLVDHTLERYTTYKNEGFEIVKL
jgi:superfamily II DNA or RNA helicase